MSFVGRERSVESIKEEKNLTGKIIMRIDRLQILIDKSLLREKEFRTMTPSRNKIIASLYCSKNNETPHYQTTHPEIL